MKLLRSISKSILFIILAIALLRFHNLPLPYLDQRVDTYFSTTMTKATVAYGVCRVINASASVIKESQIQLEPAGLGVSLAAGQLLDPLDDMTERTSDILVTAIVSLGIQKIIYELSKVCVPSLLAILLLVYSLFIFLPGRHVLAIKQTLIKAMIIITVARLFLPLSATLSLVIHERYFSPKINQAKQQLTVMSPVIEDKLQDMNMPEVDGVLGTIKNGFSFVGQKTTDLGKALKMLQKNMASLVANLLILSALYVALFIIQVILIPVGVYWFLARLFLTFLGKDFAFPGQNIQKIRAEKTTTS